MAKKAIKRRIKKKHPTKKKQQSTKQPTLPLSQEEMMAFLNTRNMLPGGLIRNLPGTAKPGASLREQMLMNTTASTVARANADRVAGSGLSQAGLNQIYQTGLKLRNEEYKSDAIQLNHTLSDLRDSIRANDEYKKGITLQKLNKEREAQAKKLQEILDSEEFKNAAEFAGQQEAEEKRLKMQNDTLEKQWKNKLQKGANEALENALNDKDSQFQKQIQESAKAIGEEKVLKNNAALLTDRYRRKGKLLASRERELEDTRLKTAELNAQNDKYEEQGLDEKLQQSSKDLGVAKGKLEDAQQVLSTTKELNKTMGKLSETQGRNEHMTSPDGLEQQQNIENIKTQTGKVLKQTEMNKEMEQARDELWKANTVGEMQRAIQNEADRTGKSESALMREMAEQYKKLTEDQRSARQSIRSHINKRPDVWAEFRRERYGGEDPIKDEQDPDIIRSVDNEFSRYDDENGIQIDLVNKLYEKVNDDPSWWDNIVEWGSDNGLGRDPDIKDFRDLDPDNAFEILREITHYDPFVDQDDY